MNEMSSSSRTSAESIMEDWSSSKMKCLGKIGHGSSASVFHLQRSLPPISALRATPSQVQDVAIKLVHLEQLHARKLEKYHVSMPDPLFKVIFHVHLHKERNSPPRELSEPLHRSILWLNLARLPAVDHHGVSPPRLCGASARLSARTFSPRISVRSGSS